MTYTTYATAATPGLVIYLLDVSASMNQPLAGRRRIDVVMDGLQQVLRQMVLRATKGARLAPRYRLAMFAYSEHVWDLLDGVKTVDQVAALGVPRLEPMRTTATAKAFEQAERLLEAELPNIRACPAPLVCHMTDGEYTGSDPEPIVRRIRAMHVPDGNVLVENIFLSDRIMPTPIGDPTLWRGIQSETPLANSYAIKLRELSSPLPESYRDILAEYGYRLEPGSLMLLPGENAELVALGFQMSGSTPQR